MMFPASDALNAERVGFVAEDSYTIAGIFHDTETPAKNNGEKWRQSFPMALKTTDAAVSIEHIINNLDTLNRTDFSEAYWEQANVLYRWVSDTEELGEDEEFEPEKAQHPFETELLTEMYGLLTNPDHTIPYRLWQRFIRESQKWTADRGTVREFEAGSYSGQNYLPNPDELDRWGLYEYNTDAPDISIRSVWLRFERESGGIQEYPLLYDTDGYLMEFDPDPDYGFDGGDASDSLLEAFEAKDASVVEGAESDLVEMYNRIPVGSRTEWFLSHATDSESLTSEEGE